jgi:amidase
MMAESELHWMSITELGEALRTRRLSPVEVTQAMLARIEALDPVLRSYQTVMAETALAEARGAEAEIAAGNWRGPLHGVPYAAKDLCYTLEAPTAFGTVAYQGWMAPYESTVTARLRAAGAVLLGKLHMTECATAQHHPELPAPINPWGSETWTGVSSSGSGVATAAGLAFGTLGSDTGGSIRFPSSACGVTGMKQTWGRVSRHGVVPLAPTFDHVGPMARTAEDAAILLQAIAGYDRDDPTTSREPVPDYRAAATVGVPHLRIGIDEKALRGVAWTVRAALDHLVQNLVRTTGARPRPVTLPDHSDMEAVATSMMMAEVTAAHEAMERLGQYSEALRGFIEGGRKVPAAAFVKGMQRRADFIGRFRAVFDQVDVLVMPVIPYPTPLAAEMSWETMADPARGITRYTMLYDLTGSPSLTVPAGLDPEGHPIGIQIIGPDFAEERLFAAGHAFQQATDWHKRRPPLPAAREMA